MRYFSFLLPQLKKKVRMDKTQTCSCLDLFNSSVKLRYLIRALCFYKPIGIPIGIYTFVSKIDVILSR